MTKPTHEELIATINYDESKVTPYSLPDPLTHADGSRVSSPRDWHDRRRPELLRLFGEHMYGAMYPALPIQTQIVEQSAAAFDGRATRVQIAITFPGRPRPLNPTLHLLVYLPNHTTVPAPCFLGLNFFGNHGVADDPNIRLSENWMRQDGVGVVDHRATHASRGCEKNRWHVETLLARGYALATMYSGDIDPDFDHGFSQGIHPLFRNPGQPVAPGDAGTITAWAWGLMRALDALTQLPRIDARRVCVTGHSRLGKTALWAGACDERIAMIVSNDSGCGGASLSRRNFGETLHYITNVKGHWFCTRCQEHARDAASLPVDQHMLIALLAPRPVFISSAEDDRWADPRGEFLSGLHASPVYQLLGVEGLGASEFPEVNRRVMSRIGYQMRPGKHDINSDDWATHLDFADRFLKPRG